MYVLRRYLQTIIRKYIFLDISSNIITLLHDDSLTAHLKWYYVWFSLFRWFHSVFVIHFRLSFESLHISWQSWCDQNELRRICSTLQPDVEAYFKILFCASGKFRLLAPKLMSIHETCIAKISTSDTDSVTVGCLAQNVRRRLPGGRTQYVSGRPTMLLL